MSRFVLSQLCHVLAREEGTLLGESQWRTRRLESRYEGEEVGGGGCVGQGKRRGGGGWGEGGGGGGRGRGSEGALRWHQPKGVMDCIAS